MNHRVTQSDTAVIVAVQHASRAKSRLGAELNAATRRALVIAMLTDVLAAIREAHAGTLILVSADVAYDTVAGDHGAEVIRDTGAGYNAAVTLTLERLAGRAAAALMLPGDLPQLRAADVTVILEALRDPGVVVVPSADGGTTALGLRPLNVICTAFGPDSAQRHRDAATAAGVRLTELRLESLRIDVDTVENLEAVRGGA
ncbi:MAG: 2-phospho-L-lactate guanylyltransferase [Chloroflexi bacterium]|nr:2-phospho-L-lactate guanylyltransferase [Chloroflexota bacterium]